MICVSLNERSVESTIESLKKEYFFEVRLDLIEDLTIGGLKEILSVNKKIIVAFRPGKVEERLRIEYLLTAMDMSVEFIDIELESDPKIIKEIVDKRVKTKVIISHHDFKKTPSYEDILLIVGKCEELGADLIKIATYIKKKDDNITLLKLLEDRNNVIVSGMGELGKISRVLSVPLGSPFTYVSVSKEKETANGQIEHIRMEKLLKEFC